MRTVVMILIGNIRTDGRVQKEIATLRERGHKVTLIQWAHTGERGGHGHLGIDVIDYPPRLASSAAKNFVLQMRFNFFAWKRLRKLRPDYVQCNDLNTLPAGFFYRRKARIVFDAHELFPESQEGAKKFVWEFLERWMAPRCWAFIQPEKNRLAYFASKHRIPASRITLVENFPASAYAFTGRDRLRGRFGIAPDAIILLYTGVLGPGREIENMIGALALLDERFVLVLLGPAFKGYERELAAAADAVEVSSRVHLHPPIPNVDMLDYIRCGDIGLIFYANTNRNNFWCASNKLYEFLLCRKFVITNDYPGLKAVVGDNRLGACLAETSPAAIAAAARAAAEAPRPSGPSPWIWENQKETYLALFP